MNIAKEFLNSVSSITLSLYFLEIKIPIKIETPSIMVKIMYFIISILITLSFVIYISLYYIQSVFI